MSSRRPATIDALRRPEYTGENRCYPCTLVNLVIAGVGAAIASVVHLALGIGFLVAALVAIYLRGYLIPGTPTVTRRYMPDRILALFDKSPAARGSGTSEQDLESYLLGRGVIEPCEDEDDVCLAPEINASVRTWIDQFADEPENEDRIARMFDTDSESIRDLGRETPALYIHNRVQRWPSTVSMLSDTAFDRTFREELDDWEDQPLEMRLQILEGLRPFHDACPGCDGGLTMGETTVESCCRSREVLQVRCTSCESVLFEIDAHAVEEE